MLAFQAGFNTRVPGDHENELWAALAAGVASAGGRVVLICNGYSFAGGRASSARRDSSVVRAVLAQSPELWGRLLDAGAQEAFRFGVDQMSKFLAWSIA